MKKILLYQTGNIGDLIITQPLAALLKQHFPGCQITVIASEYTRAIVEASPQFDGFTTIEEIIAEPSSDADAILFVERKLAEPVAIWAREKGIPLRVCNRTHHASVPHCNKVIFYSNRFSGRHQAQSYLHILRGLNLPHRYTLADLRPLVGFRLAEPPPLPALDPHRFNLIIHAGSNGHAREWPVEYFRELVRRLAPSCQIYLTGSSTEANVYRDNFTALCPEAINLMGQLSLEQLLHFISRVDGLVANSTGPLHMAATCGVNTLGLYAPLRGTKPALWGPIGPRAKALVHPRKLPCFGCTKLPKGCACMLKITVDQVEAEIKQWIQT